MTPKPAQPAESPEARVLIDEFVDFARYLRNAPANPLDEKREVSVRMILTVADALATTTARPTERGAVEDMFLVSLALSKPVPNGTTYSMTQSWRKGGTEQEAVDAAILYAAKEKPGFGVWETLVARVPLAQPATDQAAEVEAIARIINPAAWDCYDATLLPFQENRGAHEGESWHVRAYQAGCRNVDDARRWWLETADDSEPHTVCLFRESLTKAKAIAALATQPATGRTMGGEDGQDRKFAFRDGQFVNRVSGEAIPRDEPIIIFRARDWHSLDVLAFYQGLANEPHHVRAIQDRINEFQAFKDEHPDRMKEPGVTRHIRLNDAALQNGGE